MKYLFARYCTMFSYCLSPCGESGLKSLTTVTLYINIRLSPCGESGLKCARQPWRRVRDLSLPVWGEWIEIESRNPRPFWSVSLPVWGEWIEICKGLSNRSSHYRRLSPCGESGLKSPDTQWCPAPPGLSPCGESGLKYIFQSFSLTILRVSPRVGRVD